MSCAYRVHLSDGDDQLFKCDVFELKKKVAEKSKNIPTDQIVLIDKDNMLFNPNIALTNESIEYIFKQVDLQTLIMEWSKMKIDNDLYQKKNEELQNKINELNNSISIHTKEQQEKLSENKILNDAINQLRDDLQKLNKSSSDEISKLKIENQALESKATSDTNFHKLESRKLQNTIDHLDEQIKQAEILQNQQATQIQQLNAQIQEKEKINQNISYQNQQYQQQLQQWQQYFSNYESQINYKIFDYESYIKQLTEQKDSLFLKLNAENKINQITTDKISELETQLNTAQTQNKTKDASIKKLSKEIEDIKKEQEDLEAEKNKVTQVGQNVNNEVQKLKKELSKLKNDHSNLQSEKEQLQIDLESFKQQHEQFAKQTQSQLQRINQEHEEEVNSFNNKINQLNKEIDNLKKQLSDANDVIKDREAKIIAANQENQKLQQNLFNANNISTKMIQLQDQLDKKTGQQSQERQKFQNQIQDLQSQLSLNATQYETELQQLKNQLSDAQEKLQSAENTKQQQEVSNQQLNAYISERENIIQNISYQSQQQQYQLTMYWQEQFNNFQQGVAQKNQEYESQIKELTDEKCSLEQKLKAEKSTNLHLTETIDNLDTQFSQAQTQNNYLQVNVKKLQQQIVDIRKEQEDLEAEKNKATQVGHNVNNEALKLKQELSKLKIDYNNLKFEKEQVQNDLESYKQQQEQFSKLTESNLLRINKEHEEELFPLNNKINQLNTDLNNLKKQLSDANYQIKEKQAKIDLTQQEYIQLQLYLDQLNSSGVSLDQQKRKLEQTIKQQQNELDEAKKNYEAEKAKCRAAENENTQLKGGLQQKDIELNNEKANHENIKKEKDSYKDQCKKMAEQFKELQQQTTVQAQKLTTQVQVAERKIERVLLNFGETKIFEKITGPLEKIMASEFKINKFTQDHNSQTDNAQYNLIEITLEFDKYTQYVKEGKFFLIDECFQYGNKINITVIRSIQANAESEFYKGYLIKIIESAQADLKTKTLLRKDFKFQNLAFQNKDEAARLAVNNIFCQWLLIQFNKDLTTAKLQPQKQTIQRQFIIENEAKKEYYYCEIVEEGAYSKINGGKFVPQKDDIHQYFNALSLYSQKMFEQQLILTNFQVCGNYVYDMIVHTNHKGLFSPLDQGPHESMTFTEIIGKQEADIMNKSWNKTIESYAEKYLSE